MHNDVSIADMLDLEDGRKMLARYNAILPGVVDKMKTTVREGIQERTELPELDSMIDEAFLVIAMLCERNNVQRLSKFDDDKVAKNAATLLIVGMAAFAMLSTECATMTMKAAEALVKKKVPEQFHNRKDFLSFAHLRALNLGGDDMLQHIDEASKGCVQTACEVLAVAALIVSKEGLASINEKRKQ